MSATTKRRLALKAVQNLKISKTGLEVSFRVLIPPRVATAMRAARLGLTSHEPALLVVLANVDAGSAGAPEGSTSGITDMAAHHDVR